MQMEVLINRYFRLILVGERKCNPLTKPLDSYDQIELCTMQLREMNHMMLSQEVQLDGIDIGNVRASGSLGAHGSFVGETLLQAVAANPFRAKTPSQRFFA